MATIVSPDQFYTGLIAELYDPLVEHHTDIDSLYEFIRQFGEPALELGCGSGHPMLALAARGIEIHGLDSSEDMLGKCRARADRRQLDVTLHHTSMQHFDLGRQFKSAYISDGTFTLLTSDDDAITCLQSIHSHLLPGGGLRLDLETQDAARLRRSIGYSREKKLRKALLRFGIVAVTVSDDERNIDVTLRYERETEGDQKEVEERNWRRRLWNPAQISELLAETGFTETQVKETPGSRNFTVITTR